MFFRSIPAEIRRVVWLATTWSVFIIILINPFNNSIFGSIGSQEFFSFHARDFLGLSSSDNSDRELYLATGTYEKQIDGDLFGIAKGRNLIVIQVESLQNTMIEAEYNGYEITPNLNRLIDGDSIYFDNFYQQLGSGNTSDAEFAMNNSMLGSIESYTYDLYQDNYFRGLPWILKNEGYSTMVLHGYHKDFWNRVNAYPSQGFDKFISGEQFNNDYIVGIGNVQGVSDKEFFRQSIPYLKEAAKPFYSFYITLSSHHPFKMPEQLKQVPIRPEDQNTIFGDYINAIRFADDSMGEFIDLLKENDLYDNSVIAIYGDHFALSENDEEIKASVSNYLGYDYDISEMMNVPLIITIPGMDVNSTVSISGGEIDIMPTIAYLLGIERLDTLYFGQNLLTAKEGFVAQQTHLLKGSFIKDDIVFEISRDGIFENSRAWNRHTKESVDIEGLRSDYLEAKRQVELSQFYLKNDILRKVLLEGKSLEQIAGKNDGAPPLPEEIMTMANMTGSGVTSKSCDILDKLYDSGFRHFMVCVDSDHRNGSLPYLELVEWMGKHEDAFIMMDNRFRLIEVIKEVRDEYPELTSRIVPVVRQLKDYTMVEYSGYENILFMPDTDKYSEREIAEFLSLNQVWAAAIPRDMIPESYKDILRGSNAIYVYNVQGTSEKCFMKMAGIDGFISAPPQTEADFSERSEIFPPGSWHIQESGLITPAICYN